MFLRVKVLCLAPSILFAIQVRFLFAPLSLFQALPFCLLRFRSPSIFASLSHCSKGCYSMAASCTTLMIKIVVLSVPEASAGASCSNYTDVCALVCVFESLPAFLPLILKSQAEI